MKRFLAVLAGICTLAASAFGATACDKAGEHEHVFDDGVVTTEATCSAEGVLTRKCTVEGCNVTKEEPIEKKEHSFDGGVVTTEPKCDKEGVKTYTCGVCGATREEAVGKTDHTWDGGVITTVPTIDKAGVITYTCGGCKTTKTEAASARDDFGEQFYTALPAKTVWRYGYAAGYTAEVEKITFTQITTAENGVWKDGGVEISASALKFEENAAISYNFAYDMSVNVKISYEGGLSSAHLALVNAEGVVKGERTLSGEVAASWKIEKTEINAVAGDSLYLIIINAGEAAAEGKLSFTVTSPCRHVWNGGEKTKTESCTELGEMTYTCDKCGETKTEEIAKAPHDFEGGSWVAMVGGHAKKCKNCETVNEETLTPHNHVENAEKSTPATCNADGIRVSVCEACGDEKREPITARPDHDYKEDPAQSTPATCISDGERVLVCENCGGKKTEAITERAPHKYVEDAEKSTPATCHSDGVKVYVCSVCKDEKTEAITERPAHDYDLTVWTSAEAAGHNHKCKNCDAHTENVAHNLTETERKEPTATEEGFVKSTCDDCGYVQTVVLPTTDHAKGTAYGKDENNHWFTCGAHDDCGAKFDETPHDYTEELPDDPASKAATCAEDGIIVKKCICGQTKQFTVSKDTVPHSFEGATPVKDDENTHHLNCTVCGTAGESVAHSYNSEEVTTAPTFWAAGEKTLTCACGATKTESVARLDQINHSDAGVFTTENQDGDWQYGAVTSVTNWAGENFTFVTQQATELTGDGLGWQANNSEIKKGWLNNASDSYISFTAKEATKIKIEITLKKLDNKNIDVRLVSNNVAALYDKYNGDTLTISAEYTLEQDGKLFLVFTGGAGEGKQQAEYSIKISRV